MLRNLFASTAITLVSLSIALPATAQDGVYYRYTNTLIGPATSGPSTPDQPAGPLSITPGGATLSNVRVGQTFKSAAQTVADAVGAVQFTGSSVPDGISLDSQTGVFTGALAGVGTASWGLNATDSKGSSLASEQVFSVTSVAPLSMAQNAAQIDGKQDDFDHSFSVAFGAAQNAMGKVTYALSGEAPGTLVYKENGVYTHHADSDGGEQTWASADALPSDAIVFDVSALTLSGVPSKVGTYQMTLTASDDWQNGYIADDPTRVTYNTAALDLTINVISAGTPQIANVSGNKMIFGTVGTDASFTPTVTDSVTGLPWNNKGSTYSLNRTLPGGLLFDKTTGRISGNPTEAAIIRDLTVTVTSAAGVSSSTTPFWFGVAPAEDIDIADGQTVFYSWRSGHAVATAAPQFTSTMGNLVFSGGTINGATFNTSTGVYSSTGFNVSSVKTIGENVTVTDEFGRQGTFSFLIAIAPVLTISVPSPTLALSVGTQYSFIDAPTTTNAGTKSFVVTGLPPGFTYDVPTGAISGTLAAGTPVGQTWTVGVTVTDAFDNATKSTSYVLTSAN